MRKQWEQVIKKEPNECKSSTKGIHASNKLGRNLLQQSYFTFILRKVCTPERVNLKLFNVREFRNKTAFIFCFTYCLTLTKTSK